MTAPCQSTQQLIEDCQGLVRSLASTVHRKLPPNVDLEDLISYGQVGLVEAARDFDPARGSRFSTYAYYRIRGAIYDGLSKMAWFSRAHYNRLRQEQMSNEVLCLEADQSGQSAPAGVESDMRWLRDVTRALAVVYFAALGDSGDESASNSLEDRSAPGAPATAISREINEKLHKLIDELPPEAGTLIRATYFEGLTLQEAGCRLGISKSWASRLHARTLQRLARSLRLQQAAS